MGGFLVRRAVSFYLTTWDDGKSTTSLVHPPPTSLPYAEELTSPLALCGGLGVMTERSHSHSGPREMEEKNR